MRESKSRSVIIVSPYFPPSTLAGVHRARHLAKYLPEHGYKPIIIRVSASKYTEIADPELARLVDPSTPQVEVSAIPARIARIAGIGDIGIRSYPFLANALHRAIKQHRPAVVLLTGSPFYPLLLSRSVAKRFGTPVVLDFQDPWSSPLGAQQSIFTKKGLAHAIANHLEPIALRYADAVTTVSEVQNAQLRERYDFLGSIPMRAIPIGGDPDDFLHLRNGATKDQIHVLDTGKININYVGAYLPRAGPVAAALFRSLRNLAMRLPQLAERIRFNFVGTSNQAVEVNSTPVTDLARSMGVAAFVRETARRVPYLEALSLLARADALLMIGSDEPHYTASKIYPNLMTGRPFLSIFHSSSSAHHILSTAGGGAAFGFNGLQELGEMEHMIEAAIETLVTSPAEFGRPDPAAYRDYTASAIAGAYADLFNHLHAQA